MKKHPYFEKLEEQLRAEGKLDPLGDKSKPLTIDTIVLNGSAKANLGSIQQKHMAEHSGSGAAQAHSIFFK